MHDPEAHIRDWATFGIGTLLEALDTPSIRDALAARLDDPDEATRLEAIRGLAIHKDSRAFAAIVAHLHADDPGWLVLEAAEHLGDPRLPPDLVE